MNKYYVIQCVSGSRKGLYASAMQEGYTDDIGLAGKWGEEYLAIEWIAALYSNEFYTILPVYIFEK